MSAQTVGLGLLCKAPRAGFVKTRLAATIGAARATALADAFLRDAIALVAEAARTIDGVAPFVFFRPDDAHDEFRRLVPPSMRVQPQRGAELGETMWSALGEMLATCPAGAIVIGSDCPTLPVTMIGAAVAALRGARPQAVFGPAADGGYYLAGVMDAAAAPLFAPMAWSTATVMATTRTRAQALGLPIVELPTWFDVDDAASLSRLRDDLRMRSDDVAQSTRALLKTWAD